MRRPKPPRGWRVNRYGEHLWCPRCGAVGTDDDFDQAGLGGVLTITHEMQMDYSARQCLACGEIVRVVNVERYEKPMPLFAGRDVG